jgi:hypothetical protein
MAEEEAAERFINWPIGPATGQVFTSSNGNTWVFDGCGWISSCCATDTPLICDPTEEGLSIIFNSKNYGCSTFLYNSALSRYEGTIEIFPWIIWWDGSQWVAQNLLDPSDQSTMSTSDVVGDSWSINFEDPVQINQSVCGELYPQLCFSTGTANYTLHPGGFASAAEILAGNQPLVWYGLSSDASLFIEVAWDPINSWWYISEDESGCEWNISTAQTYQALISGGPWAASTGDCTGTFTLGACPDSCNPYLDGITVLVQDPSASPDLWTPTYFVWDYVNSLFYTYPDADSYNSIFNLDAVVIYNSGGTWYLEKPGDLQFGTSPSLVSEIDWTPDPGIFQSIHVYCGRLGCPTFCLVIDDTQYKMWPYGFITPDNALNCVEDNTAWIGRNGVLGSEISFSWNGSNWEMNVDLPLASYSCTDDLPGLTSHSYNALISASPIFTSCAPVYVVTLQEGDCPAEV